MREAQWETVGFFNALEYWVELRIIEPMIYLC